MSLLFVLAFLFLTFLIAAGIIFGVYALIQYIFNKFKLYSRHTLIQVAVITAIALGIGFLVQIVFAILLTLTRTIT